MNKILIIFIGIFWAINLNAQWFSEGQIRVGYYSDVKNIKKELANNDYTNKETSINFTVAPKVGYYFNDKFALGVSLQVGYNLSNVYNNKWRRNSTVYGIYPFIRYSVFTYKKFFLMLEAGIGTGITFSYNRDDNYPYKYKTEQRVIAINVLNLKPRIGFNLTENLQIATGINFLGLGYTINISRYKKEDYKNDNNINTQNTKGIQHNFDFGFKSLDILSIAQLNLSVIYKFKNKKIKKGGNNE